MHGDQDHELEYLTNLAKRKLSITILVALRDGPHRYTTLQHAVSTARGHQVHAKTLTETLVYLVDDGFVAHHDNGEYDGADYRLTPFGERLVDLLAELRRSRIERHTGGE